MKSPKIKAKIKDGGAGRKIKGGWVGCDDNSGVDKYGKIKVSWGHNYHNMENHEKLCK